MNIHLITGGARSGKSRYAEELAGRLASGRPVTYIATGQPSDDEMTMRINIHRKRRAADWITIEAPFDAGDAVRHAATETVLLDCLTLLAANAFLAAAADGQLSAQDAVRTTTLELLEACASRNGDIVIVTNEVGWSIVPDSPYGRWFRDALGEAAIAVARESASVTLVMAGCAVPLKSPAILI